MTVNCTECGKPAIGPILSMPTQIVVRAMVVCPECLEKVPAKIANAFLNALNKINGKKK